MSKERIAITIDLDYWCGILKNPTLDLVYTIGCRVRHTSAPIYVVKHHDEALNHLHYRHDLLINVDYHDDLVRESEVKRVHEGNWVTAVPWKAHAAYLWVMPWHGCKWKGEGLCDEDGQVWTKNSRLTGWNRIWKQLRGLHNIPWKDAKTIIVVLSPFWSENHDIVRVKKMLRDFNDTRVIWSDAAKYTRGQRRKGWLGGTS